MMRTIKQLLMTVAVLLCSVAANAYDFETDGICYDITSATDLTVSVASGSEKYKGKIDIPSTVTYNSSTYTVTGIRGTAFRASMVLTQVTIPNSVKTIDAFAFSNCRNLSGVTIGNGVTSIEYSTFENCESLASVTIGNSVTYIGEYAFASCKRLTSITIPNSVKTIGQFAFQGCAKLTDVTVGNSVTTIEWYAFQFCSNLASITIPGSVTMIEDYAFAACSKLASICMLGKTPPSACNFTDEQYANITLYVPEGSLEAYRNADKWKNFQNIQESGATGISNADAGNVAIEATANGISLSGAEGKAVAVYTANGTRVAYIGNYAGEEIALGNGVYIVQAGGNVMKVKL